MKKLSEKALDKLIEEAYYARCSGISIDIMDIGKVFRVGRRAYDAGLDVGDAVAAYVETIRKN
jgi:hypothetical protein